MTPRENMLSIEPNRSSVDLWGSVFESTDVDRSRAHMSKMLCQHSLDHHSVERQPAFRHRHANFGHLDIHELDYTMFGGGAEIRVPQLAGIFLVEINLGGQASVLRDEGETAFEARQLCVINAGQRHVKRWGTDGRQIFLRVSEARFNDVLSQMIDRPVQAPLSFDNAPLSIDREAASLAQVVRLMFSELSRPSGATPNQRAAASAERLFLELMLETIPHNYSPLLHPGAPAPRPQHVRKAVDFLDAHASSDLTIDDIASAAEVPVRTLQRAFRQAFDVSPMAYLKNLRLDRVRARLTAGDVESVTHIAFESGFTHLGRFSRDYRLRFGETPSETLRQAR